MSAHEWEPVVGLEIHVQLKTRTKMFCRCANGFGGGENTQVLSGLPRLPGRAAGAEPNRDRVDDQARARARLRDPLARGLLAQELLLPRPAEGISDLSIRSAFLHQWQGASAEPDGDHEIGIVRAHLEEDAAKTTHIGGRIGRIGGADYSLVDFNRGHATGRDRDRPGRPLVRGRAPLPAAAAANDRRARDLGRGMEKGDLRVDANVSVRPAARPSCAPAAS